MKKYPHFLLSCAAVCLLPSFSQLDAADVDAAPADTGVPATPWSHHLKLGAYVNAVSSTRAETSRDASINGSSDSASYSLNIDGRLTWKQGADSIQNDLILKYGSIYDSTTKWSENTDEIDFDSTYAHNISSVHNTYANVGFDSVFTGPEPDENTLDPLTGKFSAGYAFKKDAIFAIGTHTDSLESRLGVRVQRTWGSSVDRDVETGIEWFTRYERDTHAQLSYFAQYDFFSEFKDLGHNTHTITAGFDYKISTAFSLKFDLRAYYETIPKELSSSADDGYNTLSMRQETMIGFTYTL